MRLRLNSLKKKVHLPIKGRDGIRWSEDDPIHEVPTEEISRCETWIKMGLLVETTEDIPEDKPEEDPEEDEEPEKNEPGDEPEPEDEDEKEPDPEEETDEEEDDEDDGEKPDALDNLMNDLDEDFDFKEWVKEWDGKVLPGIISTKTSLRELYVGQIRELCDKMDPAIKTVDEYGHNINKNDLIDAILAEFE